MQGIIYYFYEEDVRKFAKTVNYKVEDVKHTTYEAYEEAKAKGETYRLEHADTYIS